MTICKSS